MSLQGKAMAHQVVMDSLPNISDAYSNAIVNAPTAPIDELENTTLIRFTNFVRAHAKKRMILKDKELTFDWIWEHMYPLIDVIMDETRELLSTLFLQAIMNKYALFRKPSMYCVLYFTRLTNTPVSFIAQQVP
ncbi:hypothetical protein BDV98DRAFT_575578 [Pterulicium gracile]|uniref:Uncharacterized protein n=1 Tax=Pterulicium gracile TaxID=1884261 RepID=A0A5C3QEF0_9AGAR|nr:hypothetical protein BDV98DRAFT_575578 [Pterula gracilis]